MNDVDNVTNGEVYVLVNVAQIVTCLLQRGLGRGELKDCRLQTSR